MRVPAPAARIWVMRLVAGGAIGALFGAILGAVVFSALVADSTATSLVRLTPPPELMAIATGADRTTPDTDVYISQYMAGEVAYLGGTGFARAVGASLGQSGPAQIDIVAGDRFVGSRFQGKRRLRCGRGANRAGSDRHIPRSDRAEIRAAVAAHPPRPRRVGSRGRLRREMVHVCGRFRHCAKRCGCRRARPPVSRCYRRRQSTKPSAAVG